MGRFLRGLLLGMGLGLIFAPMRGQEMRRMLSERLQSLRAQLPNSEQLPRPAQQAANQLQEAAKTLREGARQAVTTVREQSPSAAPPAPPAPPAAPPERGPEAPSPVLQSPPPPSIPPGGQSPLPPAPPAQQSVAPPPPAASARTAPPARGEDTGATIELPKQTPKDTSPLSGRATTTAGQTESAQRNADLGSSSVSRDQEPDLDMTPGSPGTATVSSEIIDLPSQGVTSNTATTSASTQSQTAGQGASLNSVPGITSQLASKLAAEGIRTIPQLLERTANKEERTELAQKISLGTNAFRALISRADLMQVSGIDADAATLLQESNVNGCKDLQRRNPENLLATLTETQARKRLGGRIPSLEQLTTWIADAMSVTGSNES